MFWTRVFTLFEIINLTCYLFLFTTTIKFYAKEGSDGAMKLAMAGDN